MNKLHHSYLFSDKYVMRNLNENDIHVMNLEHFNTLLPILWPLPEFLYRRFYLSLDSKLSKHKFFKKVSHNIILSCQKATLSDTQRKLFTG